jgi:hypothetical protein
MLFNNHFERAVNHELYYIQIGMRNGKDEMSLGVDLDEEVVETHIWYINTLLMEFWLELSSGY